MNSYNEFGVRKNSINITYISSKARNMKKHKIRRQRMAITLATVTIVTGCLGFYFGKKIDSGNLNLPTNCIIMQVPVEIQPGDTISGFADKYCNDSVYSSKQSYAKSIQKINNLKSSNIDYRDNIYIPIVVDTNDENYIKMQALKYKINDIEQNKFWVDYIVKPGETISAIASRASSSYSQTVEYTNLILSKNKINGYSLNSGTKIKAINPELGPLKLELENCISQLANSNTNVNIKSK